MAPKGLLWRLTSSTSVTGSEWFKTLQIPVFPTQKSWTSERDTQKWCFFDHLNQYALAVFTILDPKMVQRDIWAWHPKMMLSGPPKSIFPSIIVIFGSQKWSILERDVRTDGRTYGRTNERDGQTHIRFLRLPAQKPLRGNNFDYGMQFPGDQLIF